MLFRFAKRPFLRASKRISVRSRQPGRRFACKAGQVVLQLGNLMAASTLLAGQGDGLQGEPGRSRRIW